ncbi:minor capsid protein [Capybara microvirus Cap3_SP_578]|nr:minor capsid protein [Capybara microvirus Cap3_SP_578]
MTKIYSYFTERPSNKGLTFKDSSLAQQQFKDVVDINNIATRYSETGTFSPLNVSNVPPVYADVSSIGSYFDLHLKMQEANKQFSSLPSDVRSYFDNDPYNFMDFCQNPANLDKGIELGLWSKKADSSNLTVDVSSPSEEFVKK